MQRYFVDGKLQLGVAVHINEDDVHHIGKVMRMKQGDNVICCDGEKTALCQIDDVTSDRVALSIVEWVDEQRELPIAMTICCGLPKGEKWEYILQKGTELGAAAFVPFQADRSIVKWDEKKGKAKVERWAKIVKEAAEQSHRQAVPSVSAPLRIHSILEMVKQFDATIIAYEEEAKQGETAKFAKTLQQLDRQQSLLVIFGPEGGLSEKEVAALTNAGAIPCGLGPRIMRAETAPLYALSAASYHFELLG